MNRLLFLLISTVTFLSSPQSQGADYLRASEVPNGKDTAAFVGSNSSPEILALAGAVPVTVSGDGLTLSKSGKWILAKEPSSEAFCNMPFKNLNSPSFPVIEEAKCTAVLVSPIHVLTAGHCTAGKECGENTKHFIFGVTKDRLEKSNEFDQSSVYSCGKVLEHREDDGTRMDMALVKLDRPVQGFKPATRVRISSTPPKPGTDLVAIGHPTKMPQVSITSKVTEFRQNGEAGEVLSFFDTYGGNSGGPVWSLGNGDPVLEGIIVRTGERKTKWNKEKGCMQFQPGTAGDQSTIHQISSFWDTIQRHIGPANQAAEGAALGKASSTK